MELNTYTTCWETSVDRFLRFLLEMPLVFLRVVAGAPRSFYIAAGQFQK